MEVSTLIKELQTIERRHGDIPVNFQAHKDDATEEHPIVGHEAFFIVDEQYDTGWEVNLRTWPY